MNWRKPIIYSLLYLSGSKIPSILKEIKKIDKFSFIEKQRYQEEKLKKILLHVYNNVPYYHKILADAKIVDSNQEINLENFHKIPILTKEIIRREGENLYSKDYKKRKSYENTSGGSTGEPVGFLQDKNYDEWNKANKIYYKTFGNQDIGDKELRLWGSERDILEGKEKFSLRLKNWLYNRKELNAFRMSEKDMERFVIEWNKFKPQWIEAYAQSIYEFAKFIKARKLSIYSPRGVLTSAGTLYPEMEEVLREVFHYPVFNRYGSREVGSVACSDGNKKELKLSIWNNYVEILNNQLISCRADEMGKIYITTLNNYSMPLIRYDIGDVGVKGNDWEYLEKVEGREMNVFKTKDGKLIPGEFFIHFIGVVFNRGFISKFQVIQKDFDYILIKTIIRDKIKLEENRMAIEESIRKIMGEDCKIQWEFVNEIPPLKSGKYVYTISEIR